jgi:hypothetical protein
MSYSGVQIQILCPYCQLPPPGLGAIDSQCNQGKIKTSQNGAHQFINRGKRIMELTTVMRQDEKENEYRELLIHT